MGTCRESYSLFVRPKSWFELRNWKWNIKLMFEDTFMPIICKLIGHSLYITEIQDNPVKVTEWACRRCHRFINQKEAK